MGTSTFELVAKATRHYPLPGGELSTDAATVRIYRDDRDRVRIIVNASVAAPVVEADDLDDAAAAAYAKIQKAYGRDDVDSTAEARALNAAYEKAS